jgi:hypothetical protein
MSRVKKLAYSIMRNPQHLTLLPERVEVIAEQLRDFKMEYPAWDYPPFYPQTDDFEEMCMYYLLFNSINYCYFDDYGSVFTDGAHKSSTLAGLRITENLKDLKDPLFLSRVDENYMLSELFEADTPISLVKERTVAFREIGEFLSREPDFSFRKLFTRCYNNAYILSQFIPTLLPSWRDPFFKRSQLFVGMVQGRFNCFEKGLDDLTVFADYKVPQTLHSMGMIRYHFSLYNTISNSSLIASGSKQELEIRAASIVLSDKLTAALNKYHDNSLNALHIDYLLWSAIRNRNSLPRGVMSLVDIPHHRTMTTDY